MSINNCPFCGSDKVSLDKSEHSYVECIDCKAYGPNGENNQDAIEKWNGPEDIIDTLRDDCERLRRELDDCKGVIR